MSVEDNRCSSPMTTSSHAFTISLLHMRVQSPHNPPKVPENQQAQALSHQEVAQTEKYGEASMEVGAVSLKASADINTFALSATRLDTLPHTV